MQARRLAKRPAAPGPGPDSGRPPLPRGAGTGPPRAAGAAASPAPPLVGDEDEDEEGGSRRRRALGRVPETPRGGAEEEDEDDDDDDEAADGDGEDGEERRAVPRGPARGAPRVRAGRGGRARGRGVSARGRGGRARSASGPGASARGRRAFVLGGRPGFARSCGRGTGPLAPRGVGNSEVGRGGRQVGTREVGGASSFSPSPPHPEDAGVAPFSPALRASRASCSPRAASPVNLSACVSSKNNC